MHYEKARKLGNQSEVYFEVDLLLKIGERTAAFHVCENDSTEMVHLSMNRIMRILMSSG